jgi:hypothetical protein
MNRVELLVGAPLVVATKGRLIVPQDVVFHATAAVPAMRLAIGGMIQAVTAAAKFANGPDVVSTPANNGEELLMNAFQRGVADVTLWETWDCRAWNSISSGRSTGRLAISRAVAMKLGLWTFAGGGCRVFEGRRCCRWSICRSSVSHVV